MDSGAVDGPVILIIKTPNQKYEDLTINCFLNWTVERLKSHISDVYPSKPLPKDQQLVYLGRLLQDDLQLKDVLRKHDEYHMMHLVCPSRSPPESPKPQRSSTSPSETNISDTISSPPPTTTANQDSLPDSSSTASGGSDGLRHRGGFPSSNAPGASGGPQWPNAAQLAGLPANIPPHPQYIPAQMLWWQQMYAHHYYMQYQAAVAASQPSASPAPSDSSSAPNQPAPANEAAPPPPLGRNQAQHALPENQPANPVQMNAQGGAVLNDDEMNRDWLDWLYTLSRASVLLSIIFFYSSTIRMAIVAGAMLLFYLYQAGWFPFRAQQQNRRAGQRDGNRRHQEMQEMERLMDEGVEEEDSGEEGPEDGAAAPAAANPEPNFLAITWTFISTFFTSLIPDARPHQAN